MRSVLVYTLARFAIFMATGGVLLLAGARGMLLLALAVLISGIVSYVLLSNQRDAMSGEVVQGLQEQRRRFQRARTKEDGGTF
jgi:hypothetical protein